MGAYRWTELHTIHPLHCQIVNDWPDPIRRSSSSESLDARVWEEGSMIMATRKRHSPEQVVRKFTTADRLLSEARTWRRCVASWGSPSRPITAGATSRRVEGRRRQAAEGSRARELDTQAAARRRRAGEGGVEGDRQGKLLSPERRRAAVRHLMNMMNVSERFACRVTGQHRATQRREPTSATSADPDTALRAWLRGWAKTHPRRGFRNAYADARGEGWHVNHERVQRSGARKGCGYRNAGDANASGPRPRRTRPRLMRRTGSGPWTSSSMPPPTVGR